MRNISVALVGGQPTVFIEDILPSSILRQMTSSVFRASGALLLGQHDDGAPRHRDGFKGIGRWCAEPAPAGGRSPSARAARVPKLRSASNGASISADQGQGRNPSGRSAWIADFAPRVRGNRRPLFTRQDQTIHRSLHLGGLESGLSWHGACAQVSISTDLN